MNSEWKKVSGISRKFFQTTGRDEFPLGDDQLYHEGIDIDRAFKSTRPVELSRIHQDFFAPNYEETKVRKSSS